MLADTLDLIPTQCLASPQVTATTEEAGWEEPGCPALLDGES